MKKTIFTGSATALITPLNESGVDFDTLRQLIEFQIENKTDALVICGTTGEAPTLEDDEHLSVIDAAVKIASGRIPVIAGTGSNNTNHACMMSREAEKLGADGLLWVTPYYNKATQDGLYLHYKKLAESTSLPGILYNVPSRTGVDIKPETVEKLSDIDNIVAIKEATGDVSRALDIVCRCGEKLDVYSGNDDIIVPLMSIGAKGVISVLSNVCPLETHDMCACALSGDFEGASALQQKYFALIRALFSEVNPIPVKAALKLMGLDSGIIRLPLCEMKGASLEKLKSEMEKLGII